MNLQFVRNSATRKKHTIGNYESIREIGYINWLKEQERKTGENFDNIEYLEKRRSK